MKHTLTLPTAQLPQLTGLHAPFALLEPVKNRVLLILFCGVFSFLFMYIFSPFNMNQWYQGGPQSVAGVFGIFSLCGMAGLSISQFGLMRLKGRKPLNCLQFLGWFAGEVMLVALVVNIVNVSIHDYLQFSWLEYSDTLKFSFGVMALPYSIALLWFYNREKVAELRHRTVPAALPETDTCLHISDEYGKLVLSLQPAQLLLLKAEDNYVQVFYRHGQTIRKELIRNSLKKLEGQLAGHGFVRAHRSYMVNLSRVILFRKNSRGHYIQIDGLEDVTVPVSGSCLPEFQQRFTPAV